MYTPIRLPKLLMPREGIDLSKWAVIACDQYTSQPDYWNNADAIVGDAPSTLRLTLPEVYLEQPDVKERTAKIQDAMLRYQQDGTLTEYEPGMMLVERTTKSGTRRGVVLSFDLEAYDYQAGSQSLIRPTEKTVVERIPPRLAVREGASLELPHIMLLIDDPDRKVIEPLFADKDTFRKAYDTDLMLDGGHLSGWFVPEGKETAALIERLNGLADPETFNKKYGLTGEHAVLPYAVGDGNHSMATAKAYWEEIKKNLTEAEQADHPARYALAEIVNIHDEAVTFEPIHRVLLDTDPRGFLEEAAARLPRGAGQSVTILAGKREMTIDTGLPLGKLVALADELLTDWAREHGGLPDYIHGDGEARALGQTAASLGLLLPRLEKSELFPYITEHGPYPKKSFSIGHARDKRYYLECRSID